MKTTLVSLISEQTIPNVQFINELKQTIDHYIFITTEKMMKNGVSEWIKSACSIQNKDVTEIQVNQFEYDDIIIKLDQFDFDQFDKKCVNLTGGTKMMTLAAFDYFKELGAEIYYVTGTNDEYIKLSPGRRKKTLQLYSKINLNQYLTAYGFKITQSTPSGISQEQNEIIFKSYLDGIFHNYTELLNVLRSFRNKAIKEIESIENLDRFITDIGYSPKTKGTLDKYEVKYLTGEWFEDFVANKIKSELNLSDNEIETGLHISKKNKNNESITNEMDVLFVFKNNLYTIECKTSIYLDLTVVEKTLDEVIKMEEGKKPARKDILAETIYKSDALRHGFGLFVKTAIFVLDDLGQSDKLKRAELSNIKVVDKSKLTSGMKIHQLLNINL